MYAQTLLLTPLAFERWVGEGRSRILYRVSTAMRTPWSHNDGGPLFASVSAVNIKCTDYIEKVDF
jgi:hypothetical protein